MVQNEIQPLLLIKFGSYEHMVKLLELGELYCNTRHYFATLKDEYGIGDKYEIIDTIENLNDVILHIKMNIEDEYKPVFKGNIQQCQQFTPDIACGNLYCLYQFAIPNMEVGEIINIEVTCDLYDYCVVIWNTTEFLQRVNDELDRRAISFNNGKVQYLDYSKYDGAINPFMKDKKFENQNEFRYFIHYPKNEALPIHIGSIKDIAVIMKKEDLIKFQLKRAPIGTAPKVIEVIS
jgi:hypothetical protein